MVNVDRVVSKTVDQLCEIHHVGLQNYLELIRDFPAHQLSIVFNLTR